MSMMGHSPMKEKRKSYLLRINEKLWEELNQWSSLEFRSVNGQIELILRRAVDDWKKRHAGGLEKIDDEENE
jgi:hypothetical protein